MRRVVREKRADRARHGILAVFWQNYDVHRKKRRGDRGVRESVSISSASLEKLLQDAPKCENAPTQGVNLASFKQAGRDR